MGEASIGNLENEDDQEAVVAGIDKLSRLMEIPQLFEGILQSGDRRQARQRRTEDVEQGRDQLALWFEEHVLRHKVEVDTAKADDVKWDRENGIFADVLLQADEDEVDNDDDESTAEDVHPKTRKTEGPLNGIPIGHFQASRSPSRQRREPRRSVLFPAHRAVLIRSELFATMFASPFREGQELEHLQIVTVDCSPEVLSIILTFLYTEKADFGLNIALDVLHASDMLFIERLKQRAALFISTLGNGSASIVEAENPRGETDVDEIINVYDVVRAGWDTRVHRLEEFGARYIAYRLERYIDEVEFKELVQESAGRIQGRQETDTVELIDDIRYYLSERFRLRFEDAGLDELMDEEALEYSDLTRRTARSPSGGEINICRSDPPPSLHEDGFAADLDFLENPQPLVRTLDGEIAGDEFAQDAINYQILLGKIEKLMEDLGLDG